MSFLFTFSLPKLPFRNPFSIGDSDGVASERNRAGGTLTSGEYYRSTGYHAGSSRRRRHLEDEQPHHEQRPVGRDGEISNEAGYPVSRKRKAMMSSFDDGRGNEYDTVRTLSHRRGREGAFIEDERETYCEPVYSFSFFFFSTFFAFLSFHEAWFWIVGLFPATPLRMSPHGNAKAPDNVQLVVASSDCFKSCFISSL
ncbi:hypothetical protein FRC14_003330 [Serendipita sp. 396]|nr:hypothetical protein FRC14_003330 [Serendipita sp. 396]